MSSDEQIRTDSDDADVLALLPRYLTRRSEDMVALRDALERQDFDTIAQLGHQMRGSGKAYGLGMISDLGFGLEQSALVKDAPRVADQVEELGRVLKRIVID